MCVCESKVNVDSVYRSPYRVYFLTLILFKQHPFIGRYCDFLSHYYKL